MIFFFLILCIAFPLLAGEETILERHAQFYVNEEGKEVFHGYYKEFYPNKEIRLNGTYVKGLKNGDWKSWSQSGNLMLQQQWNKGIPDGDHKSWYANGQMKSLERYQQGIRSGRFESWFENGQRESRVEYSDNILKGAYQKWYANGQEHIRCLYKDGKIDGNWTEWNTDGTVKEKKLYRNGVELKIYYYNEKYPSGAMKMAYSYYKNEFGEEVKHGPYNKWFPNGENWLMCEYYHDQLHGLWQYGKMEGLHCRQENYHYGKKDGRCAWYHQGKITREEFWENGVQVSQKFYDKSINGNGEAKFE